MAVAEGVEDEATRRALSGTGCDYQQGYLFSRPVPAAEAASWLRDRLLGLEASASGDAPLLAH